MSTMFRQKLGIFNNKGGVSVKIYPEPHVFIGLLKIQAGVLFKVKQAVRWCKCWFYADLAVQVLARCIATVCKCRGGAVVNHTGNIT